MIRKQTQMARGPRLEFEGAIYHVMARGNERREFVESGVSGIDN
jgi:hypothetical protein